MSRAKLVSAMPWREMVHEYEPISNTRAMTHEEYETLRSEIVRKYEDQRRSLRRERHLAEDKQQELSREYTRLNNELMRLRKTLRHLHDSENSLHNEQNKELMMLQLRYSREA